MTQSLLAAVVVVTLAGRAPLLVGSTARSVSPVASNVQFLSQRWHVVVEYNGNEAIFDYNPQRTVKAILERAIHTFRITQGQPPFSLFNLAGLELPATASGEDAGIQPGDHLLVRPSKVKAGS